MAAVTICSDFGAQKNKVWHCFHCFPIYLPWSDKYASQYYFDITWSIIKRKNEKKESQGRVKKETNFVSTLSYFIWDGKKY